jgi:hypothetical protein
MAEALAVSRRIAPAIAAVFSTVTMAAWAIGDQTPAPAPSAVAPTPAFEAAFRRGDLDETTRLLQRAGRDAAATALAGSRTSALAAMWAVQERGEPWPLPPLAAAAGSSDRRRALAATQAALAIATRLGMESAEAEDLDGETLTGWQADWLAVARRTDTWIDVRSDSVEVAVLLGRLAAALEPAAAKPGEDALSAALLALLADEDPAMRRAALELLGTPLARPVREEVARLIVSEAEPAVARAAAAALCSELGGQVAGDVMGALGTEGMSRIRELAKATTAAVASDVELARCLAADGRPESRAAMRELMQAAQGPLRKALSSVERGAR